MKWTPEHPSRWDDSKEALFSKLPDGVFDFGQSKEKGPLPGIWWRVEDDDGAVVGYGWVDYGWGEAEVLAAVDPDRQGEGIGAWIFDQLAEEARSKGHRYMANFVRESHPARDEVRAWLEKRGFEEASDGRLMRKV